MNNQQAAYGLKVIGIVLLAYALLTATHEGEFWPFSIYPMFSQAGNPWTRAIILDVSDADGHEIWQPKSFPFSGETVVPVGALGVDQIDYSNFVTRTSDWTEQRTLALYNMLSGENLGSKKWLILKVHGQLTPDNSVEINTEPLILITRDSLALRNSQTVFYP